MSAAKADIFVYSIYFLSTQTLKLPPDFSNLCADVKYCYMIFFFKFQIDSDNELSPGCD